MANGKNYEPNIITGGGGGGAMPTSGGPGTSFADYVLGLPSYASYQGFSQEDMEDVLDLYDEELEHAMTTGTYKYRLGEIERDIREEEALAKYYDQMIIGEGTDLVKDQILNPPGTKPTDKLAQMAGVGGKEFWQNQLGLKEVEGYDITPGFEDQTLVDRVFKPATRAPRYMPSDSGMLGDQIGTGQVWQKGSYLDPSTGEVMSDKWWRDAQEAKSFGSTTGYGYGWGTQGKLSNLKFNPESGLYEKQFSLGKGLTAAGSLWSSFNAITGEPGTHDDLFRKGSENQTLGRYAKALAPALALTPLGWGGAAALQTGISLYDQFLGDTQFDDEISKMKFGKIGTGQNLGHLWDAFASIF